MKQRLALTGLLLASSFIMVHAEKPELNTFQKQLIEQAQSGNDIALYRLGMAYLNGIDGFEKDIKEALICLNDSGSQGYSSAYNQLGALYLQGSFVDKDVPLAIEYFEKCAEMNDFSCSAQLGDLYYFGHEVSQDHKKAMQYYLNIDLQKADYLSESFYHLGRIYEEEVKQLDKAIECYENAANYRNRNAIKRLIELYRNDENSMEKAKEYRDQYLQISGEFIEL